MVYMVPFLRLLVLRASISSRSFLRVAWRAAMVEAWMDAAETPEPARLPSASTATRLAFDGVDINN